MIVLLVDDDRDLREILAELLGEYGHEVAVAANGEAALQWLDAATKATDVIILDWMMPGMNGLEFRRRQRADPRIAKIPVVLMSAATKARIPHAELTPDAALYKPVAFADLLQVLERVVNDAHAHEL